MDLFLPYYFLIQSNVSQCEVSNRVGCLLAVLVDQFLSPGHPTRKREFPGDGSGSDGQCG